MNKNIIVLNEVESTNNYAKQLVLSNTEEATVVLAQFQKKGRGQQGNNWESETGKNLLASLILYPRFLNAGKQFDLSKIVSLGIAEFLKKRTEQVSIKWPNDIYVGNDKIAGILIENTISGNRLHSSVLGIGLNLNQEKFCSDAPNPISLKQITGEEYNIHKVAAEVVELILKWYNQLIAEKTEEIEALYLNSLFRRGGWFEYSKSGITFEAKIVGIGQFGQLKLQKSDGEVEEFMFKEVEFVFNEKNS